MLGHSDWVTSLRISPQTCTGLLMTAFAEPAVVRCASSIPVCLCHRHADEVSAVPTVFFSSPGSNMDCASRMRRRYVGAIAGVLRTLRHGCRGHRFGTRKIGRQMFRLDPKSLVGQSPGPEASHAGEGGRFFQDHRIGSASSLGGEHCTSSDGFGASSI